MSKVLRNAMTIAAFSLILTTESYSQTLTEQIGGVNTNFEIASDTNQLDIKDQIIIKRGLSAAASGYDYDDTGAYGHAYGYGLETYRLEFMTASRLRLNRDSYNRKYFYKLEFFDSEGNKLLKTFISRYDILFNSNGEGLKTYSINLQHIPLIVLNKAKRINVSIATRD